MRIFITALILIISLQSWTKAEDISDFEIEGMSIGDSALDYFSESFIKKRNITFYPSDEYLKFSGSEDGKSELYDTINFHYKKGDTKYIIHSLGGAIFYENNMKQCKKKMYEIVDEMSETFKDAQKRDDGTTPWLEIDETGNTVTTNVYFIFENGDYVEIACYDWSDKITKEKNYTDHLKIALINNEFGEWLNNLVY